MLSIWDKKTGTKLIPKDGSYDRIAKGATPRNLWTTRVEGCHNPHVDDVDIDSLIENDNDPLLDKNENPVPKTKVPYPKDE